VYLVVALVMYQSYVLWIERYMCIGVVLFGEFYNVMSYAVISLDYWLTAVFAYYKAIGVKPLGFENNQEFFPFL
jgi:hypothetical protein